MAKFILKIDSTTLQVRLTKVQTGLVNKRPLMRQLGEIAHASITENFEVGGRPRWKALAPSTIKRKGHDRILIGKTGNLSRITMQPGDTEVTLGTNPAARKYAAIHQYGGRAGRNHSAIIPARPYMLLQREDDTEMRATIRRYVLRLAT